MTQTTWTDRIVRAQDGEPTMIASARRDETARADNWYYYDSRNGVPLSLTLVGVSDILGRCWHIHPAGGGQAWLITPDEETALLAADAAKIAAKPAPQPARPTGRLIETEHGLAWQEPDGTIRR